MFPLETEKWSQGFSLVSLDNSNKLFCLPSVRKEDTLFYALTVCFCLALPSHFIAWSLSSKPLVIKMSFAGRCVPEWS